MDEAVKSPFQPGSGQSAGQMLRSMRENAGVELEVLASSLKVPPQKIQALESDNLEALPAIFFARGLAANICRHFGVDPHPVLAVMPDDRPRIATDDESINTPFDGNSFTSTLRGSQMRPWLIMGGGAAALLALVLFLYPTINQKMANRSAASAGVITTQVASAPSTTASAPTATITTPTVGLPLASAPALPAASAAAPTPASAASVAAGQGDLSFTAKASRWVQVRNQQGKTLFERELKAGEVQSVAVPAYPVRVVVGRAENISMTSHGQPFNLAAIAATGVARFEVK